MLVFLARRLITVFLPTLLGMSILVFFAMRMIPGNFVDILIGIGPDVSQEQREAIARSYAERPRPHPADQALPGARRERDMTAVPPTRRRSPRRFAS